MTKRLEHLEKIFPNLASAGYSPRSEKSAAYNCIAFAAGDETRKWEGYREVGYHWPEGAKAGYAIEALISAFGHLHYSLCDSEVLESDCEKVALYVDKEGFWTHAAKQCDDGQWMSKLGNVEDIIHRTPDAVAGPDPAYGEVACYMKRSRESQANERKT